MNMNNFMATNHQTEEILGKFVYYSLGNILVEKEKFCEIGKTFNLMKVKPSRESATDAFRNATSDISKRVVNKYGSQTQIHRIYCRDNSNTANGEICRELVKETLQPDTNIYRKLANIYLNKEQEYVYYDNVRYDNDIDIYSLCDSAVEKFSLYRECYGRKHIETVIESLLEQMESVKISVHGKLFFVPKSHINTLDLFEDYLSEIGQHNKNDGEIISNSMFVVDDEKQRSKMTQEFYSNFKGSIEMYQERLQHFIDSGCKSDTVINRWLLKIDALNQKKQTYENILKQELNNLDEEFSVLTLQSQELQLKVNQIYQMSMCA